MALTDPKDTLAYHQARPLTVHRDMSEVPCKAVAQMVSSFLTSDTAKDTKPEAEALWFYGMNHGMALIGAEKAPLEPLDPWELKFVNDYHAILGPKAVRAFYYLLIICTREARHNKSLTADTAKMKAQFGVEAGGFFASVKGSEHDIHKAFLNSPPKTTLGQFVECIRWQFYNSKWAGGYGGKKWGVVTDCLNRFVKGEFTAEMMLDTVWTLAHNGGPIFNKGHAYSMYSHNLVRALDVQRSGQIPEAVLEDKPLKAFASKELVATMKALRDRWPEKIGTYVKWDVVEALGSVQKYPTEKSEQYVKYGMTPEAKAALEAAEAKKIAAQKAAEEKAKQMAEEAKKQAEEHAKTHFWVMPGVEVKKVAVARAA